jgi:hypothetical protein
MVKSIEIKNFKCFKELKVEDLGRITLLGGRNNVGKTAFLEALFLLFDRMPANKLLKQTGWRGLDTVSTAPDSLWAPIFTNVDLTQVISISAVCDGKQHAAKYTFSEGPKLGLLDLPKTGRTESIISKESLPEKTVRTDLEYPPTAYLEIEYYEGPELVLVSRLFHAPDGRPFIDHDRVLPPTKKVAFLSAYRYVSTKEKAGRFTAMEKAGEGESVEKFLKLIEPRLKKISLLTEGGEAVMHGDVGWGLRPIPYLGCGVSNMLDIILSLGYARHAVLLVDEIENGIYRRLLPNIWEALGNYAERFDCQIIATTHSDECIKAAHQGLAKKSGDFRYIRLDRENDTTRAKVSDHEMLGVAIDRGLETR